MFAIDNNLARISIALCLTAVIATIGLVLPGEYVRHKAAADYLFVVMVIGPYLLLGLLAWRSRGDRRASGALLALILLLAAVGLFLINAERSDYQSALATHSRGTEYMRERFQRMAVFVVPALQWLVALLVGTVWLMQAFWERARVRQP